MDQGFEKIERDYEFLLGCFQEVLVEIGYPHLASALLNGNAAKPSLNQETARVLSIAFQLLNLVEENAANQIARQRSAQPDTKAMSGTWVQQIQSLCPSTRAAQFMSTQLGNAEVEIVLTAHPTESKKWSILDQHRELYLNLFELENQLYTETERAILRAQIKNTLERLWRTGEIPATKPDLVAERETVLYYLGEKFPEAIRVHDQRLKQIATRLGWRPKGTRRSLNLPQITFGTWVGGDRDGHPFVTATVTRDTFTALRQRALQLADARLLALSQRLPLSAQNQELPPDLAKRLHHLRRTLGRPTTGPVIADEPWREYVLYLRKRLPTTDGTNENSPTYRRVTELQTDLRILENSLNQVGAHRLVDHELAPVQRETDIFGFHLATLDIRQNSSYLEQALGQLLDATQPGLAKRFKEWSEDKKVAFLNEELKTSRPLTNRFTPLGKEATETLKCLRACLDKIRHEGRAGIGSIIISMTRNLSDLLMVYVLCREVGMVVTYQKKPVCLLPIVPLFETRQDLENGPAIIEAFLKHPVTQHSQPFWDRAIDHEIDDAWLRKPSRRKNPGRPRQQVMVGYSDSNKDCGIIASLWAIRRAQIEMSETGRQLKVDIQFFHGRGGTISRGAGPTHRFLDALPGGSVTAGLRLTEQGETIGQKYSNVLTAAHNLELLLAGTLASHARPFETETDEGWNQIMDHLSVSSRDAYQALIHRPGFEAFFHQATPIDVLSHSRMGSRPAARTGKRTIQDMRAIPWTFSWNQARFYLPGWYGAGSALEALYGEAPDLFEALAANVTHVPFLRYVFFNLEGSLESADTSIMSDYAKLVTDSRIRKEFLSRILDEHQKTHHWLQTLLKTPTKTRRPRFYRTLHARDRSLRLLHQHQIRLLRQWRKTPKESVLNELLVVVNAIASGQRTTG